MIYGLVSNDMLPAYGNQRVSILSPGETILPCCICDADVSFSDKEDVIEAACSKECYDKTDWMSEVPVLKPSHLIREEKAENNRCPKCNGPAKGRGFRHEDDCELNCKFKPDDGKKKVLCCPTCGGMPRGRGFAHKANCQNSCHAKMAKEKAECC